MSLLPQVRSSWLKYSIRSAKLYAAPDGPRILDAIGTELRSEIRKAPPLAWMPIECFIGICRAARDALGVGGARAFWRKSLHDCIQQPLIRPLAMGGLYLFGQTPDGLYRRTPQAWGLVTRRAGEMSTEPGPEPDSMWLHVRELPPESRFPALLHMWEGGFAGQADFVKFEITVDTNDGHLPLGRADFLVRWRKASLPRPVSSRA
jgi:hypothetical protein